MADIKEPPKKGLVRGLLGRKPVPKSQKKEKEREDNAWKKKLFGYLEGFKKSFAALEGGKEKKKGGFLKGLLGMFGGGLKGLMSKILGAIGLTGIFAKIGGLGLGAALLPAAIIIWGITGAFNVIQDWVEGFKEDGLKGGIAKALGGGAEGGIWNSVVQASKWGGIGALAGLATFGPIGALVGGLLGIAFGAIFGWLGSDKIKGWLTKVEAGLDKVKDVFGFPTVMTDEEKQAHKDKIAAIEASIADMKKPGGVVDQIEAEIEVYEKLQEEGTELTLKEMQALGKLYDEKKAILKQIADAEKEKAGLERDLERQKLADLNAEKSKLQTDKDALTMKVTRVGDTDQFVQGEIYALQLEIQYLERDIKKAKKEGNEAEVKRLTNAKAIATLQLNNKKAMLVKIDKKLEQTADQIYEEQQRLDDLDLLSGWEKFTFTLKTYGRNFMDRVWNPFRSWLAELPRKIGNWIFIPKGQHPDHPSPAMLFGVKLVWPEWMKKSGLFIVEKWNALTEWFDNTITRIGKWIWNSDDSSADSPGKLFGITIPTWSALGTSITTAWNNLTTWADKIVQRIADWIWKGSTEPGQAGVLFDTFTIPTWEAIGTAVSDSWDNLKKWGVGLVKDVAGWIWTGGEEGKGGVLFNTFTIPTWSQAGDAVSTAWDNLKSWAGNLVSSIGAWIYTGQKVTPGPHGTVIGAKIFGVQLPPLLGIGDAISAAWNNIKEWVTNLGLWFWNKPAGTMFGNFQIPTLSIPDIEWDVIVQGLMGKVASMIGKIPFIDRVPGMSGFLKKWGVDDSQPGDTQADVMPPEADYRPMSVEGTKQLQGHEGFREKAYEDTVGKKTIGYGFNLEKMGAQTLLKKAGIDATVAELMDGLKTITQEQATKLMDTDIEIAHADAKMFFGAKTLRESPQEVQDALINMAYNMGAGKISEFTELKKAIKADDWKKAAAEMRNSKWATQVKGRSEDLASIVEAIGHSKAHMRTDLGLLMEANKGILPVKLVGDIFKPVPPKVSGDLLSAFAQQRASGGTTINNVTVAPTTSNTSSNTTIAENTYGVADPYTSASGAYG